jgi:aminoglycoside phosphotransferase (APT) family kinase protein
VSDPQHPGIEHAKVTAWLEHTLDDIRAPLSFSLIAGGRSNLTYRVTDSEGRLFALRRPPLGPTLPTAHDVAREFRLLSALWPTPVPVPEPLALCGDSTVTGAPFTVMGFVDGTIVRTAEQAIEEWDESNRQAVSMAMADTLGALHSQDIDAVGLGNLARRGEYLERQIRRWGAQVADTSVPGIDDDHQIAAVAELLHSRIPEQIDTTVVHGDFRIDNCVVDSRGDVAGVLDWELATLGDPLADLGTLLCYWNEPGEWPTLPGNAPTTAPGFATRAELVARYEQATGRSTGDVEYYRAFACWKLACVIYGVYARYQAGSGAGDQTSVEEFPHQIDHLAGLAASLLE